MPTRGELQEIALEHGQKKNRNNVGCGAVGSCSWCGTHVLASHYLGTLDRWLDDFIPLGQRFRVAMAILLTKDRERKDMVGMRWRESKSTAKTNFASVFRN